MMQSRRYAVNIFDQYVDEYVVVRQLAKWQATSENMTNCEDVSEQVARVLEPETRSHLAHIRQISMG